MLAVMSAFVAFNGFPGQDVRDPIGTLLLQQRQTPVNVPAEPVGVNAPAGKQGAAAGGGGTTASQVHGPNASTGPVGDRSPAQTPAQDPTAAPGSTSTQGTSLVPQDTLPSTPTTPQIPQTDLPPLTVPSLPPPPTDSPQLPLDTSGVTSLLGGG
jgi:hypothetical protein